MGLTKVNVDEKFLVDLLVLVCLSIVSDLVEIVWIIEVVQLEWLRFMDEKVEVVKLEWLRNLGSLRWLSWNN